MREISEKVALFVRGGGPEAANLIAEAVQRGLYMQHAPVAAVKWVPIDKVIANDYNPNRVAHNELKLLAVSIKHDGYTQPIVTVYDSHNDRYIIVDGFHRHLVMKTDESIKEKYRGLLPIVVIDKTPKERMASTVRHNRARGKHTTSGMGYLVAEMIAAGATQAEICNELGLEPDEMVRISHMTGVASLFKDRKFSKSWKSTRQIEVERG